jgi:ABC-type bacteriocin/lantibiotic exporter with double-glycine peptidase domain
MQDIGRYLIEIIGITLLVIFIFILTKTEQSGNSFITLAVFGAALFRIMPILNRISTFTQRLKFGLPSSIKISEFYNNKENKVEIFNHLDFQEKIKFEDISYKFKGKRDFIIKNLNFEINKNEIFGILGESGIGKTTLSNIIMGLIKPSSGKILVDGKNIIDEKLSIQENIAFVPQNFFHTDDTLINNITFFEKKINLSNLKFAIKNSLLINPILNKSLSLKTDLGNNALKISGGQLQRVSLARALYRRPKILVLDEPTSFLDKKNQDLLKEILFSLRKRMTIILISHNQSIFKECDKILDLNSIKN